MGSSESTGGTQSIERAVSVLRVLASANQSGGMSFMDVCQATGLTKGTTYRILRVLKKEGFVAQHGTTRLYHLGMDFLALGPLTTNRLNLRDVAKPFLERLAHETEDTLFLSVPSGMESICVDRCEGSFPIKALTLNIGDRRPLGVGAGALALLAWQPDPEVKDIIGRNARRLRKSGVLREDLLTDWVRRTRENGYAFNDGQFLGGMCAIGVPVLDRSKRPIAALSIAAISERMSSPRREVLVGLLGSSADQLSQALLARGG